MSENKEKMIGFRVSENEKEEIKKIAKKRNLTIADFLREAIFTHIYHLNKANYIEYIIDMSPINETIKEMNYLKKFSSKFNNLSNKGNKQHNIRLVITNG